MKTQTNDYAKNLSTSTAKESTGQYISSNASLADVDWYHKDVTRTIAEAMLMSNAEEGTYLLRSSTDNQNYVVSARLTSSVRHYTINHDRRKDLYVFGVATFDSLNALLQHFDSHPVLTSTDGQTIILRTPYKNNVKEHHGYTAVKRHSETGKNFKFGDEHFVKDYDMTSKEGFLEKRGAIHKNWKERWIVVQKSSLQYFDTKTSKKPIRTLDLTKAIEIAEDTCDNKMNCFRLKFSDRTFYFVAHSHELALEWINMFEWKIKHYESLKEESK